MVIKYNDEELEVQEHTPLKEILQTKGCEEKGTAVAVNGKLIKKEDRGDVILRDGDSIIVVKAAYGG
ncbi:MAG: sulfur carrier protein ThiS [Muribaculaceae bacterium]|nr:sulfur carrier protein ThiS [Muribaculaceae bacterium]